MLFADYQPSVPTQHRPSDSHTIHLQDELLFNTILSLSSSSFLRADVITITLCRADVVFDTQSFFLGGPDVLPCQSARPTSMIARPTRGVTLPGPPVVHCYWCSSARPSSSSATCHSFPGPSQPSHRRIYSVRALAA